jgi:hypothetical protein
MRIDLHLTLAGMRYSVACSVHSACSASLWCSFTEPGVPLCFSSHSIPVLDLACRRSVFTLSICRRAAVTRHRHRHAPKAGPFAPPPVVSTGTVMASPPLSIIPAHSETTGTACTQLGVRHLGILMPITTIGRAIRLCSWTSNLCNMRFKKLRQKRRAGAIQLLIPAC